MNVAEHFGLERDPFARGGEGSADSPVLRRALAEALDALRQGARLINLVGPAGSGKDVLLGRLQGELLDLGLRVRRLTAADEEELAAARDDDVLLVDELRGDLQAALRAALDLGQRLIRPSLVIASLEPLGFGDAGAADCTTVELSPLSAEEARTYLADRVAAGGRRDLFTGAALDRIVEAAEGSRRRLRVLAGNALLDAALEGSDLVTDLHAGRAAAMLPGRSAAQQEGSAPESSAAGGAQPAELPPTAEEDPLAEEEPVAAPPHIAVKPADSAVAASEPEEDEEPASRSGWSRFAPLLALAAAIVAALVFFASPPGTGFLSNTGILQEGRDSAPSNGAPEAAARGSDAGAATPPAGEMVALPQMAPSADVSANAGAEIEVEGSDSEPEVLPGPIEAAAQEAPVPASTATPPRVYVHFSAAEPGSRARADAVAAYLRANGYDVADLRPVDFNIGRGSTRYFFAGDEDAARPLNEAVSRAFNAQGLDSSRVMDMTTYSPSPDRGTVEVWVPGAG